jgi:hypothetical protein
MQEQGLRIVLPIRDPGPITQNNRDQEGGLQMIKLYRDAQHPQNWVAFVPNSGWVAFPAKENGWEFRSPARGLDPLYLREVPLHQGFGAGVPQLEFSKVA